MPKVLTPKASNVFKQKGDGRYFVNLWNCSTSRVYGATRAEAKKKATAEVEKAEAALQPEAPALPGLPMPNVGSTETLGEYMKDWIQKRIDHRLKEEDDKPLAECKGIRRTTLRTYESAIRNHIQPHPIAAMAMRDLDRQIINDHYRLLRRVSTERNMGLVHAIMHKALEDAVFNKKIPMNHAHKANVFWEEADKKHRVTAKKVSWTKEHRQAFFDAAANDRLEAIYIVGFYTGLREGELLGLLWEKVVIESDNSGYLIVDQQLEEASLPKAVAPNAKNGKRLTPPKSFASIRKVNIGAKAIEALRAHRKRMEAEAVAQRREITGDSFVFCTTTGTAMSRSNLINRSWKPILAAAGVPKPHFHGLRGLHASVLHAAGEQDLNIMKRMGHSDLRTTQQYYITVAADADRGAAERFEGFA